MTITAAGLQIKTLVDLRAEIAEAFRSEIHPGIDADSDDTVEGQVSGIISSALREAWEALLVAYQGRNDQAAEGVQLDWLAALTGTTRKPATKTLVRSVTVNLDAAQSFLAGALTAHVEDLPDRTFVNRTDVSSTTAGNYPVDFIATETGPIPCPAGKLNTIAAPVTGWNSVVNPTDGVLGKDTELDPALAARRRLEVQGAGQNSLGSMIAAVSALVGVDSVRGYENVTTFRDLATGLPRSSFELVVGLSAVNPATSQEIVDVVLPKHPTGIGSFGNTSDTATDPQGKLRRIYYSLAQDVQAWITVDVQITKLSEFGVDGADLLKQALVDAALLRQGAGDDLVVMFYRAIAQGRPGVYDVPSMTVGLSASPTGSANLSASLRQRFLLDTSRIVVNVT